MVFIVNKIVNNQYSHQGAHQNNNQNNNQSLNTSEQRIYSQENIETVTLLKNFYSTPEVIFIDAGVEDYQTLVNGVRPGISVFIIDSQRDGVEQINQVLTQQQFTTVHIVSHGSPGCLYLGNTQLNLHNIHEYTQNLKGWFYNNQNFPSLLIYGCNVATGHVGKEFIEKLHQLTGANIRASKTPVGNRDKGGNWELEVSIDDRNLGLSLGVDLDLDLAFTTTVKTTYKGILANFVVNNTNDSGSGSLRQAIEDANANGEADTITFDAALNGQTITLTSGELLITDDINIQGNGADQLSVSGGNTSRVFKIDDNDGGNQIDVTIEGLTITDGQTPSDSGNDDGGGLWNRENLTLKNAVVSNNQAIDDGGGIRNDGTLNIINTTVANNISQGTSSTSGGGGLHNSTTGLTFIVNSTFSDNQANFNSGNGGNGGGIRNDGTLNIINTTLSGNNAASTAGGGGAIANSIGTVNIDSSTITNNTAAGVGAGVSTAGNVTVTNSIIAANTDNKDIVAISIFTFVGTFTSGGNNLIGNGDGVSGFTNGSNQDIVGTSAAPIDPLLGALQDNGGVTEIHALLIGSPAINTGSNTKLVSDTFDLDGNINTAEDIPVEQRGVGFERILNGVTDIGAYEYDGITNITSTTADGGYKIGDQITITVEFSENVTVTGTPQLTLETGTTDRVVDYSSGDGTNILSFIYTVQAGDESLDLDYLSNAALSLNGGTIQDISGNDPTLTLPNPGTTNSLAANKNIIIDTSPPTVTNITSSTADGGYKIGDQVTITVEFSENVTVTGTPQLTLETGTIDRVVDYSSGDGTNILSFIYTVQAGDESLDLDYISDAALSLNSGTIQDIAGNDAILTLPDPGTTNSLAANKNIIIDTNSPTVTNITSSTADGTYKIGDQITVTVEFSENVTVAGTGTPQLTLETGTTDRVVDYSSGSGTNILSFIYTVQAGDESLDLDYISNAALSLNGGTIQDIGGNNAILTLPNPGTTNSLGANKDIIIDINESPQLLNNTLTINESGTVTISSNELSATDNDDDDATLTFTISNIVGGEFRVDGTVETSFTQQQISDGKVQFIHLGNENPPSYDVEVSDSYDTDSDSTTINFTNVNDAPTFDNDALLAAVDENTANPPGDTINNLLGSKFQDPDSGASFSGIAVVGNDLTIPGKWQYSTDGITWSDIGSVDDGTNALALEKDTKVRFLGAANYNGTPSLTVRALDNTYTGNFSDNSSTQRIDVSTNGGTSPVSANTNAIATTINPIVGVMYVNSNAGGNNDGTSWNDAYTDLQSALAVANSGDEIWVAQGTYKPTTTTDRNATFELKDGVAIYGGFVGGETNEQQRDWQNNVTTLSGDIGGNGNSDNSYVVITGANGIDSTAILDGFTISDGNNDNLGRGGGIYNYDASPTISNVIIINNVASEGGGIYNGFNSSPTLTNITITNNYVDFGGGIYNVSSSNPIITNVNINNNSAEVGGGIYNSGSNPTLTNVQITNNQARSASGGGIYNSFNSNPTLTNVTIAKNSAINGGGGGIFNNGSNTQINNSIIWDNNSTSETNGSNTFTNSIVKGSGGSSAWNLGFGTDNGGNLDVDPQFIDPGNEDFHLQATSPAINTGDNTYLPLDTNDLNSNSNTTEKLPFDLNGNPRIQNSIVDIGAYELQPSPGGINPDLQLWLKADTGVTETGGQVSEWNDQSGNKNDVSQTNSNSQPTLNNTRNNINGQSVINFDGNDDFLNSDRFPFTNTGSNASVFIVSKADNNTQESVQITASLNDDSNRFLIHAPWDGNVYWDLGDISADGRLGVVTDTSDQFYLWSFQSESGIGQNIFQNGTSIANDTNVSTFDPSGKGIRIGWDGINSGAAYQGDIAEIIIYDQALTDSDRNQVESYLSLKYGTTLDSSVNYVDSFGNIIYESTGSLSGYINDIAGIGKDDGSALNQTQSRSVNSDSIVIIGNASDLDNGEFLIWGNNNDDNGTIEEVSTGVPVSIGDRNRLDRVWRVSETGDVGSVDISFDLSSLSVNGTQASDFNLLIDNDGDFTTGATSIGADSFSAGIVNFTGVDLNDGNYYTLATPPIELVISEIMYDSDSDEPDWEWLEIYNPGNTTVDLTGYILDDDDNNALTAANIASGSISPNQTAILYNADAITENDFTAAWGGGINLVGVSNWSQLNNTGDKIGLWSSVDRYSGDNENHNNAIDTVDYSATDFPDGNGVSIYLSDLNSDNSIGTNWSVSSNGVTTPTGKAYASINDGGNDGNDIASPGGLTPVNITSTTPDGTYKIGETINITVEFSENVNVTGTPQLTLETGTTDRVVDYSSGSGTNILNFSYIIQAGDE
ncbi:MAG: DUF4347 domain-containing protein, partial [Mastigocoleus sp.]